MKTQPTVSTERVDDIPLLFGHMQRLDLARMLDEHFTTHGNHRGLSLGQIVMVWLAHILIAGRPSAQSRGPVGRFVADDDQLLFGCPIA